MSDAAASLNRYWAIIERIFFARYKKGESAIDFSRDDLSTAATELGIALPKNLGDVLYAIRFRTGMPPSIIATEVGGLKWIVEGAGRAKYRFVLSKVSEILPNQKMAAIKVPDATPEIIGMYALDDEQALLAKVRYNRLLDTFLGLTTYSLQNHLRSTVKGLGQLEIDELYVGLDRRGCHYLIPVQAKGGKDKNSVVQARQDFAWCAERWPGIRCRLIAAYFIDSSTIAMFELTIDGSEVLVVDEKQYRLVSAENIDAAQQTGYTD